MSIAFWCVFGGILLPYVSFGIARNRGKDRQGRRLRDNRDPRDFPNRVGGLAKRAWDAHLNAFESLPGFAAAVIIAHLAQAPQAWMDVLALAWLVARVAHLAFYLGARSTLRSSAQFASLCCVLGLFIVAGLGGKA